MKRVFGDRMSIGVLTIATLAVLVAAAAAACVNVSIGESDAPSSVTEPGGYTKLVVDEAIERYEDDGLEETLAHYNSQDSVDGEWYVFVIDEGGFITAHAPVPENVGKDLRSNEFVASDGFHFGRAILDTNEDGDWVTYTYLNPNSGDEEQKHSWVIEHDGMIFGSGWYQR